MKITRRLFIGACCGIFGGLATRYVIGVNNGQRLKRSFYVAGARFHAIPLNLKVGDPVTLHEGTYNGGRSLAICDSYGRRLGYVPRTLVSRFQGQVLSGARVSALDKYSVPWKKLQVSL
jgi:hypothetical protein